MLDITHFALIAQIIFITLFLTYVFYIVNLYGVQPSLSNSYYVLPTKISWIWSLLCVISIFTIGPALNELSLLIIPAWRDLWILAVVGLSLVGLNPAFRKYDNIQRLKLEKQQYSIIHKYLHFIGAGLAALSTILWTILVALEGYQTLWFILIGSFIVCSFLAMTKKDNVTWWLEMAAFANLFISVEYLCISLT